MKKLILVTSPPACGKTFISKQLAKALNHVVYLEGYLDPFVQANLCGGAPAV